MADKKAPPIKLVQRRSVPINEVDPNPWNPNMQDPEIFRVLAESVKEEGWGEPILVREVEHSQIESQKKYQIINGEHRYRLALEMGLSHVPIAVANMDEINAKLATLRRNRTRGGLDTIKTAELLADMRKRLSDDEITQRLGYSSAEMDDMIASLTAPFVAFGGKPVGPEDTIELNVTPDQGSYLDKSLVKLSGKRVGRFEGKQSRKARGIAEAAKVLLDG